ncbi:MAG: hypothetical protein A2Z31_01425 [candidate division NC10 bacterium RBG_16_65_8]|nr:MAG: hypothetical protein A2Z31_01425 [candidate division NC10 bacterium RBG_16_65_8]
MRPRRPQRNRGKGEKTSLSAARLDALIEEALVDAYGDSEQRTAFFTVLDDSLSLPFTTQILGLEVTVERLDLTADEQIVAICRHGRERQRIPILDLPLPSPPPQGADWIAAYRRWVSAAS